MSYRRTGILHRIDEHWTPEQAAAVYECLDELMETILSHYGAAIHEFYKHDRVTRHNPGVESTHDHPELPF